MIKTTTVKIEIQSQHILKLCQKFSKLNSVKFLFNESFKRVQFNNNSTLLQANVQDSDRVIFIFIARDFNIKLLNAWKQSED